MFVWFELHLLKSLSRVLKRSCVGWLSGERREDEFTASLAASVCLSDLSGVYRSHEPEPRELLSLQTLRAPPASSSSLLREIQKSANFTAGAPALRFTPGKSLLYERKDKCRLKRCSYANSTDVEIKTNKTRANCTKKSESSRLTESYPWKWVEEKKSPIKRVSRIFVDVEPYLYILFLIYKLLTLYCRRRGARALRVHMSHRLLMYQSSAAWMKEEWTLHLWFSFTKSNFSVNEKSSFLFLQYDVYLKLYRS